MTTEQQAAFNRAAHIYSEATGMPAAAAVEKLTNEPGLVGVIATALRDMAGASPLADELDVLFAAEPKVALNLPPTTEPVRRTEPKEPTE